MSKEATINTDGQEDQSGSSSTPQDPGDLVSTIDLAMSGAQETSAETKKTDEGADKDKGGEKPKEEGKETPAEEGKDTKPTEEKKEAPPVKAEPEAKAKGQEARYDKDPAWQRIIQQRNEEREARIKLEGRLETLEKQKPGEAEAELDYRDILKMSKREIAEALDPEDGDPKALFADLARQTRAEVIKEMGGKLFTQEQVDARINEVVTETTETRRIEDGYEQFAKENPGFDDMWKSGELQEYVEKNPWHTHISAFLALSKGKEDTEASEKAETDVQNRIKTAVKEAEDRVRKESIAKGRARTLGDGPAAVPKGGATDPRLTDTKKHGGTTRALTQMLEDDAQAAGG